MNARAARSRTAALDSPIASVDPRSKRLLQFLRRKGRSREDAEDLLQEAMLRLSVYVRTAPVLDEEAFLRHAATNLSIDQHRRSHWDPSKQVPLEDLNARAPLISTQPTPEEVLESQQRFDRVCATLDALSPLTREIFLLSRAGYSYAEIARHLHISNITIKRHVAHALHALMEYPDDAATLPSQQ